MPAAATPRSRPSNNEHALHNSLLDMYPQRLHVSEALRELEPGIKQASRWMVLTLCFLRRFHFLFHGKRFSGVNDVDYCTRSCGFKIFQKCPSMTAVGVRGVYALGREVI
jgi:hypothetical protein